ncbi:MAG: terminase large subunit domain-containing protein, partial [Dolichospermum sp.]
MTLYELFTPNPGGQAQFLELAGWNTKDPLEQRWSGAIGGINSGKSFAGAVWACTRALLDPKARGMITANDYGQLSRATLVTLVEVCRLYNIPLDPWRDSPEDQALAIANCQRCYIGPDRAFVYVISANNFTGKSQTGRGLQIRWVWADEFAYASEQAFLTIDGRLGRGPGELKGQGIMTTSPSGYNYVYWKFGDPTRDERIQKLYKMASLSSLENIHSEKDYVESLKANYTDELYLQEIEGQFINTSVGVIYKYFSRTTHALQSEDAELLEYDQNLPLLLTFDFNHTPIVCLAAQRRGDEIHFCKEWFLMDSDIWELTENIVDWVEKHGIPPEIQIFGDATGRARTAASRLSSWDIVFQGLEPLAAMRGKGYLVRKFADANPFVVNRVHSVN